MTPLHTIVTRMKRLPLQHQAAHLKALIDVEKPRSIRRGELEAMLKDVRTRLIRKENRAA
ncbi:hypothetical protein CO683_00725 [Bradyrhizobium ottawaense]|uniref:hypothetical protein n=1 Tax=Bradyrhizobium ottawaense TaxID=931866 RepID=UPI000BEA9A62|nr:hypothetical protein [Bradyrhizobium ottawaense]PDT71716.1 hypothetical protein CO683_00725 [Bradyrhizobium ottawaense]